MWRQDKCKKLKTLRQHVSFQASIPITLKEFHLEICNYFCQMERSVCKKYLCRI